MLSSLVSLLPLGLRGLMRLPGTPDAHLHHGTQPNHGVRLILGQNPGQALLAVLRLWLVDVVVLAVEVEERQAEDLEADDGDDGVSAAAELARVEGAREVLDRRVLNEPHAVK